jgi:ATP-binding cassette subfamily B (MDR/TAP) protein 8
MGPSKFGSAQTPKLGHVWETLLAWLEVRVQKLEMHKRLLLIPLFTKLQALPKHSVYKLEKTNIAMANTAMAEKNNIAMVNKNVMVNTSQILRYLKSQSVHLVSILVLTLVNALVQVYIPIIIGKLVTSFSRLNTFKLLSLVACQGVLTCLDITLVSSLGENIARAVRLDLFQSLINKPVYFHDSVMHMQLVSRLNQDVSEFKHVFKQLVTSGLQASAQVIGSVASLFYISSSLSLVLSSTMPLIYIAMNFYGSYLRQLSSIAKSSDYQAASLATEALLNIRTVKSFGTQDFELDRYKAATLESSNLANQLGFHIGVFQSLSSISIGSMILVILSYGGRLVSRGDLSVGDLMAYLVSTQNAQGSLAKLSVLFSSTFRALDSATRMLEFIDHSPKKEGKIIPINGQIEFKNVSFVYPSRKDHQVIDNLTLSIPSGKFVALCGPSGSGKSTIGQLIEAFYDSFAGQILIDGVDLLEIDGNWLRQNIGYINQEPALFSCSILENIRYGNPSATDQMVHDAARLANAHEFIESFPQKYHTPVGERGFGLSGGQRQRIAIARILA